MNELFRRLHFLLHRDRFERDLAEEMQHHLLLKQEQSGIDFQAAQRQFGNLELLKEHSRDMWTITMWEQFAQDVRYGLRAMVGNRLFTAMAVLSLALGIGANTAIYSFLDAVLLQRLPVNNPEELVIPQWRAGAGRSKVVHGLNGSSYRDGKAGRISPNYPYAAFEALQQNHGVLSVLVAHCPAWQVNLIVDRQAEIARGEYVSGGFFDALGVTPAAGRLIGTADDRTGAERIAVISYSYWQSRFDRSNDVVGKAMTLAGVPFTIVGVTSPGFFGVQAGIDPAFYIPLHTFPLLATKPALEEKRRFFDANFYWVEMLGRLRPGVTMKQAQAQLAGDFRHFVESTASSQEEHTNLPVLFLEEGASGLDSLRRQFSKPLFILMGMAGLILVIACANIANLMLARATARRREMAVRLSLGAGRMRVVRQLLTESLLLSAMGAVLGLAVAEWGIRLIAWLFSTEGSGQANLHASLNLPVLAFTLALAVATGLVFGLAPALQSTRVDVTPALKENRASATPTRTRFGLRLNLGHMLVTAQISISLLLVIAASLFVHTLANLKSVELGFNKENLLVFNMNAIQGGYKGDALARFYAELTERFRNLPGVKSAGFSSFTLVSHYWNGTGLTIPGSLKQGDKRPETAEISVDPGFLETMQIPILQGRGIGDREVRSPRVAVVSQEFVKQFFSTQNPIGQRIGLGGPQAPADIEIIGVARNSRYNDLRNENPPVVYIPYTQEMNDLGRVSYELRTVGDPLQMARVIRQIVHQASEAVPVSEISTQAARVEQTISQERAFANLVTCFAALALVIACVGLYGTMAYTVARRTGEIGIRMALGARREGILWMVVRQVLLVTSIGLVIGLMTAWESSHLVASYLFGVKPAAPLDMAASVVLLLLAAAVAGYVPAWRASRIDPMVALRHE